jgi:hypothetical protein
MRKLNCLLGLLEAFNWVVYWDTCYSTKQYTKTSKLEKHYMQTKLVSSKSHQEYTLPSMACSLQQLVGLVVVQEALIGSTSNISTSSTKT